MSRGAASCYRPVVVQVRWRSNLSVGLDCFSILDWLDGPVYGCPPKFAHSELSPCYVVLLRLISGWGGFDMRQSIDVVHIRPRLASSTCCFALATTIMDLRSWDLYASMVRFCWLMVQCCSGGFVLPMAAVVRRETLGLCQSHGLHVYTCGCMQMAREHAYDIFDLERLP